jgi:chromosome segregation ATPase
MRTPQAALGIAALVGLNACATGGDACATANQSVNLFSLMSASASGSYDQCLSDMRQELAAAQLRSRLLQAEAANLRAEQRRLSGEQAAAAGRLAALNERQATAVAQLQSADRARSVETAELQRVLAEERALSTRLEALNAGGGGASAAEAERLQAQQDRLRSRIGALGE